MKSRWILLESRIRAALQNCDHGQGLLEYALIMVLVSIAAVSIVALLGPFVADLFQELIDKFP